MTITAHNPIGACNHATLFKIIRKSPAQAEHFLCACEPCTGTEHFHHDIPQSNVNSMQSRARAFLVIARVAAVLGSGGIAGTAMSITQLIIYVAIILFAIAVIGGAFAGRRSNL